MEPVPGAAAAFHGQAPGNQLFVRKAPRAQVPGEFLPPGRRVADAEPLRVGTLEAALGQEGPPRRGTGALKLLLVELGRGAVRVQQPPAPALLLAGHVPALLVPQIDPGPSGQPLDRLDERETIDRLNEPDDVSTLAAGEAVVEASCGGDVEGGRLLLVERAQALERVTAGAAKLEVLPDHLIDRRPVADHRYVLVADPARHLPPPLCARPEQPLVGYLQTKLSPPGAPASRIPLLARAASNRAALYRASGPSLAAARPPGSAHWPAIGLPPP